MMRSYYEILSVSEDSNLETIKSAYHNLLRRVHPDKSDNADTTVSGGWERVVFDSIVPVGDTSDGGLEYTEEPAE